MERLSRLARFLGKDVPPISQQVVPYIVDLTTLAAATWTRAGKGFDSMLVESVPAQLVTATIHKLDGGTIENVELYTGQFISVDGGSERIDFTVPIAYVGDPANGGMSILFTTGQVTLHGGSCTPWEDLIVGTNVAIPAATYTNIGTVITRYCPCMIVLELSIAVVNTDRIRMMWGAYEAPWFTPQLFFAPGVCTHIAMPLRALANVYSGAQHAVQYDFPPGRWTIQYYSVAGVTVNHCHLITHAQEGV